MSRIKDYDLALYGSINNGVYHFIDEGKIEGERYFEIYSEEALNKTLAFLCLNDIHHTYSITPLTNILLDSSAKSLITLSWDGDEKREHICFLSTKEIDNEQDSLL